MTDQPSFHAFPTIDHALSIFQTLKGEVGITAVMNTQQFQPNGRWCRATREKIFKHVTRAGTLGHLRAFNHQESRMEPMASEELATCEAS